MRSVRFLVLIILGAAEFQVSAAQLEMIANPARWKLQNYVGSDLVAWGAGTPCTGGVLMLPAASPEPDKARFFAFVLAAKTANRQIFVWYEDRQSKLPNLKLWYARAIADSKWYLLPSSNFFNVRTDTACIKAPR
jgi:hypothetical protein